jgi:hypothetical protein
METKQMTKKLLLAFSFLPFIYAKQNHSAAKNALAALELCTFFDTTT